MNWSKTIATLGPIGYLPAPGTCASAVSLLLVIVPWPQPLYFGLLILASGVAAESIRRALPYFDGRHDPPEIVIDELVGILVTFYAVPISFKTVVLGFALFRLFDIIKPFGIPRLEKFGGPPGIILDDIAAGLFAGVTLHVITKYF